MDVTKQPTEEPGKTPQGYTLYVFPFSLYSIMARLSYSLGKSSANGKPSLAFNLRLVNLHRNENIAEDFLINVNPKGQVPALTGPGLPSPLADSLDISYWLCSQYPSLLPASHEAMIRNLLSQLHGISGLSISVPEKHRINPVPCPAVDKLLAGTDISEQYRHALNHKREFHRQNLERALEDESIQQAEDATQSYLASLLRLYDKNDGSPTWLLGPDIGPTLLDAHSVPFMARLMDCEREALIPPKLREYALRVMALPEWSEIMHGRPTVWSIALGHVRLMTDF